MQSIKQRAIKHLRIAIENDRNHLPSTIALCDVLSENGEYEQVEAILVEAISKTSKSPELYFRLSEISLMQDKHDDAINALENAIILNPHNPKFYKLGSDIYHSNKLEHLSIPYLEKLIDLDALDGEAHFKLSRLITDAHDFSRRKLLLEIAIELLPKNILPMMDLALLLVKAANEPQCEKEDINKYTKEAEKLFLNITKISPKLGKPWYHLGILNFNKNKLKEAENFLYKSLEFDDSKGISAYKLGTINLEKKKWDSAQNFFNISLKYNTQKSKSLFEIAIFQFNKKKYKEAVQLLEKAIEEIIIEEKDYYCKSEQCIELSNFDAARKYLKKGINAKKIHSKILVKLFQTKKLLLLKQNEENQLKKAIELDSENPESYFELGMLYSKEKKWEEAKRNFWLTCNNDWSHTEAHFNLGQILIKNKELKSAIMHLQIVLDLNKSHKMADKLLKKCLSVN